MTVSSLDSKQPFTTDGIMDTFPFDFRLLDASHLNIWLNGLLLPTLSGYSVTINANGVGGNVIFDSVPVAAVGPDPNGLIERSVPLDQNLTLDEERAMPTGKVTDEFDKLTMICQQLAEGLSRTVQLPVTAINFLSGALASFFPLGILQVNAAGNGFQIVSPSTVVLQGGGGSGGGGGGGGSGNVIGPATSTGNAIATFADTSGTIIQDGPAPGTVGNILVSNGAAWTSAAPVGNVAGPANATDHSLALYSGTTGKLIKNGPGLGTKFQTLQSNGPGADPSFTSAKTNPLDISRSPFRRSMWWQPANDALTTLVPVGASAITAAGVATSVVAAGVGKFIQWATSTTVNTLAGVVSPTVDETRYSLNFCAAFHIRSGSNILGQRVWIGIVDTDPSATDTTINGAAFRFSTSAGDTNLHCVLGDGATSNVVDSGVVYAANTEYRLFIDASVNGVVDFYINEAKVASLTTIIPSSVGGLGPCVKIKNLIGGTARQIQAAQIYLETL